MSRTMHGVYAITDEFLLPDEILDNRVLAALQGGITMLQYRNKSATPSERQAQATRLLALCRQFDVPLVINDDVALCKAVGADGVHLGQQDGDVVNTRNLLGDNAIIGVTCHNSLSAALRAQEEGASYVAFGRFFTSATKPDAPAADIELLHNAAAQLHIPMVAIGGITAENGAALLVAGANMLAVIHYLFSTPSVTERARQLDKLFAA